MASKIQKILDVVSGSMIFPCPLGEYHIAKAIRDANRCGTTQSRFQAARVAARKTRLVVSLVEVGSGNIKIRNNSSNLEYIMEV